MSDYIDKSNLYKSIADREEEYRSALLKEKDYNTATALQLQGFLNATTLIKHLVFDYPTVDAEPVRYGRWQVNETNGHKDMTCLSCGWLYEYYDGLEEEWNYCPHCGALQSFAIATEKEIEMRKYIDADALKAYIEHYACVACKKYELDRGGVRCGFCNYGFCLDAIDRHIKRDAEPVVRCKDCIHYYADPWGYGNCVFEGGVSRRTKESDFCSWGERKEDADK